MLPAAIRTPGRAKPSRASDDADDAPRAEREVELLHDRRPAEELDAEARDLE
jgi:hypothetical protein